MQEKNFYNLWGSANSEEEEKQRSIHKHIPAPRRPPPSHAESYNPPPEYLLDAKEVTPIDFVNNMPAELRDCGTYQVRSTSKILQ